MNKSKNTSKVIPPSFDGASAEIKPGHPNVSEIETDEPKPDYSELTFEALNIIQDVAAQIENLARVTLAQKFIVVSLSEKEPKFHFNPEKFEKAWNKICGETEENESNFTENE